jgi:hypothetical protein
MIPSVKVDLERDRQQVRSGALEMKSVSPWFQTAQLLNGIRKTVSEIEANRAVPPDRNPRSADSQVQRTDAKKSH